MTDARLEGTNFYRADLSRLKTEQLPDLVAHNNFLYALACTQPDGALLASAGAERSILLWTLIEETVLPE